MEENNKKAEIMELVETISGLLPADFDEWGLIRFWKSGDDILCRTEAECNAIADFIEDVFRGAGFPIRVATGYYDPAQDERNGEVDEKTGFYYVCIE